ncbi:hypothetical protein [Bacillus rubiinfantis]|uniref:hypothetical protein n=1 Tax=Bacillus rubiinfantis TaxID=1499680 RepID=UPI0005AB661F|nr:hypothetical protein [Bacillus rubiinfantis]
MASMKKRIQQWVRERIEDCQIDSEAMSEKRQFHYFKLKGFCDEPEIFLVATGQGVEWGYNSFIWDGPGIPLPTKKIIQQLAWEDISLLTAEEKRAKIIAEMTKAVAAKKKEYRKCQYCHKKMHETLFYDQKTCSSCAQRHLKIFID